MILGRIWKYLAAAGAGIAAGLWFLLQLTQRQRDRARLQAERQKRRAATAEQRIDQRRQADQASRQAKEEGDANVQEAIDRARTGRRDHFE